MPFVNHFYYNINYVKTMIFLFLLLLFFILNISFPTDCNFSIFNGTKKEKMTVL